MTDQEPLKKLIEMVNDLLSQGKDHQEVISILVSSGLEQSKAIQLVETIKSSRKSHSLGIIKFFSASISIVSLSTYLLYSIIGRSYFIDSTHWFALIFCMCFILFGCSVSFKNNKALLFRFIVCCCWLFSSTALMVAMYYHPDWDSKWLGTGGGWRGQLITLIGNLLYNMSPIGISYIMAPITALIILLLWSEFHQISLKQN